MSIKKIADGKWLVDIRVGGKRGSPRKRKILKTKEQAKAFEREIRAEYAEGNFESRSEQDNRLLTNFIEDYFSLYGDQLRDAKGTKNKLLAFAKRVNNPKARELTTQQITSDRAERLKKLKVNTVNNDVAYIKAMFNEMIQLGHWQYDNPAVKIKKLKVDEAELAFLTFEQMDLLLADLKNNSRNPDVYLVAKLAMETGARWMEAETIKPEQIFDTRVLYKSKETKGRRHRTVPISEELAKELKERKKGVGYGQRIFESAYSAFRHSVVKRCKIELPEGQMSHVLRHTFASHFMMGYGNIITLQKVLGHVDIKTTMRYAHLAPDYLDEVIDKSPLALLREHKKRLKEESLSKG